MSVTIFTATGEKKGTLELPAALFAAPINRGLMHQYLVLQQSNRRQSSAHVKTRGEVQGSTKKLFSQKHTGRARRGPVRSPLLRGGGKAFGPRNIRNFVKDMPQKMRHAALRSCLSLQAGNDAILVLESYPDTIKTKQMTGLLKKLPVELGRRILFVVPSGMRALALSVRNIPRVKALDARYLNPEDILTARHVIFLKEAIAIAEQMFGRKEENATKTTKTTKTKSADNQSEKNSA